MNRRPFLALALIAALPLAAASGQQVQQLPRITPTTGLADSALFLCADSSKTKTRACKFSDVQKRLAYKAFDSLVTGNIRITGTCTGCAPAVVDSATGAARAQILTTARTIGGVSFNGSANIIPDSATGSARSQTLTTARTLWGQSFNGSANVTAAPTFSAGATVSSGQTLTLTGTTITGAPTWSSAQTFPSATTIGAGSGQVNADINSGAAFASINRYKVGGSAIWGAGAQQVTNDSHYNIVDLVAGSAALDFAPTTLAGVFGGNISGTGAWSVSGGAGNMTIKAGTGVSRTLTLQATNAGSVAVNSLVVQDSTVLVPAGRVGQPGIALTGFATTGLFHPAGGGISVGAAGTESMNFTNSSVTSLQRFTVPIGSSTNPGLLFQSQNFTGLYAVGNGSTTDSVGISSDAVKTLTIGGGANAGLVGGAGNMTIQAGTGASRNLFLQTTTSGSTATTAVELDSIQRVKIKGAGNSCTTPNLSMIDSTGTGVNLVNNTNPSKVAVCVGGTTVVQTIGTTQFAFNAGTLAAPGVTFAANSGSGFSYNASADSIIVGITGTAQMKISGSGGLKLPILPAEGSTKNAMCWDNATFAVTQNAAATCTVSSARFKENIVPLSSSDAWRIVAKSQLHSSTYNERVGGRKAIGIIAEQADSADTRLASRDAKGLITSTNYEEVTSLLLMIVKDQQRQLDSIKTVLRKGKP